MKCLQAKDICCINCGVGSYHWSLHSRYRCRLAADVVFSAAGLFHWLGFCPFFDGVLTVSIPSVDGQFDSSSVVSAASCVSCLWLLCNCKVPWSETSFIRQLEYMDLGGAVITAAATWSIVSVGIWTYGLFVLLALPWTITSGCMPLYSTTAASEGPSLLTSHDTRFLKLGWRFDVP